MKNRILVLACVWMLISMPLLDLNAQNVNYSQYHLAPVQTNPAMIATSNQMQVIMNYRNQSIGAGTSFETPMVSFIYPWIKGGVKRKAAFGLSFLQDKTGAGGILTSTGGVVTGAINLNLNPVSKSGDVKYNKFISFGAQAAFFQRRVNQDALASGAQWDGSDFDPNLGLGEQFIDNDIFNASKAFPLVNAGALFYMADACGNQKAYFGVTLQNVNQPNTAFFSEKNPLPLQMVYAGGMNFDAGANFTFQPNIRWVRVTTSNEFRLGSLFYYNIQGAEQGFVGQGKVGVGAWYDSNSAVAISLEVDQPKYFLGFSYDLGASAPINNLGSASWEVSLGIKFGKKCFNSRNPLVPPIKDTTVVEVKGEQGDSLYTIVATLEGNEVIATDTIDVKFIPAEMTAFLIPTDEELKIFERKAFFYYLSDDINKATSALLDDIAKFMIKYKGVKITLEGHTCNIGVTEESNMELSERRANSVKKYLLNKGIESDRLEISGFGSARPILSNKTEYGRIKNRRVEFRVLARGDESK